VPYLGLIVAVLWIFCLIDVITADEGGIRHLPKTVWLLLVVFLPLAGSVAWLVAGRPVGGGIWGGPDAGRRGRPVSPSTTSVPAALSRRTPSPTRSSCVGAGNALSSSATPPVAPGIPSTTDAYASSRPVGHVG
jgi:hypothetical protein